MSKRGVEYLWIGDQVMTSIAADDLCVDKEQNRMVMLAVFNLPCGPLDNLLK